MLTADLDMEAVDRARRAVPQLTHDRDFDPPPQSDSGAPMIRYALSCEHDHGFEAWFGSSSDYDDQAARGLVECPFCASRQVAKQIMAPAVAGTKRSRARP